MSCAVRAVRLHQGWSVGNRTRKSDDESIDAALGSPCWPLAVMAPSLWRLASRGGRVERPSAICLGQRRPIAAAVAGQNLRRRWSARRPAPLGIEADEAAAVRLSGSEIVVAPLVRRAFDGCDVTIRADENAQVTIQLRNPSGPDAKAIQASLAQLVREKFRQPLDDLGGYLLVHRSPGDKLRVSIDRPHLVFDPGERISLQLQADLKAEAAEAPVAIERGCIALARQLSHGKPACHGMRRPSSHLRWPSRRRPRKAPIA